MSEMDEYGNLTGKNTKIKKQFQTGEPEETYIQTKWLKKQYGEDIYNQAHSIFDLMKTTPIKDKEGVKYDNDKLRFDLLESWFEEELVDVLTFGAKKYADDNWKYVDKAYRRYYAASRRHLSAWWGGEEIDPESGKPHLAHVTCCVYFLRYFERLKEEC